MVSYIKWVATLKFKNWGPINFSINLININNFNLKCSKTNKYASKYAVRGTRRWVETSREPVRRNPVMSYCACTGTLLFSYLFVVAPLLKLAQGYKKGYLILLNFFSFFKK